MASSSDTVPVSRDALESLMASVDPPPDVSENFNPEKFLAEFERACQIDYRLSPPTIFEYMRHVQKLLNFLDKHPIRATRPELRRFFMIDTARNAIKAVRVLYGRFMGSDMAKCFKIPQSVPSVVLVPTKGQLRQTYEGLKSCEMRAAFLLLASSGLRRHEAIELTASQIDLEKRMILPQRQQSQTKFQWVTFFNDEAATMIRARLLGRSPGPDEQIFTMHKDTLTKTLERTSDKLGFKITPKVLRYWFCNEMGRLGVQDRYIDAFCGRIPKSVLARHYTDYSPERLKEVYDKANLRVFDHARDESTQTTLSGEGAEAAA